MAKNIQRFSYVVCLLVSILVNIFFFRKMYYEKDKLSWSQRAAEEAEAVAAISCSGNGRVFVDGIVVDGKPICECYSCYGGNDCSLLLATCPADVEGGDPLFLEPFWMQNAASSAVVVAGWHRMSYFFPNQSYISKELEKNIRKIHAIAKNAITDGRYIVFGVGSTQLLNAAVHALSMESSSSSPFTTKVVANKIPYYSPYKFQTEFFQTLHYEFEGDSSMLKNKSDFGGNVIEFVTSPNNPDGNLRNSVLKGPNVKTIYDRAYYWPHYTAIPAPADEDLMIFSISKLTGHAGSRVGWAIVKDVNVYKRMMDFIDVAEMGTSKDGQLRALTLLKVVAQGDDKQLFNFAHQILSHRWEKLSRIFSLSKRFSLQRIPTQYCTFLDRIREPSPAYAWVKCKRKEDKNCTEIFRVAKIIGRPGSKFFAENRYVRLSLLKGQHDFEMLISQMKKLVSQEGGVGAQAISSF
ncbi:tryptophan aminotransferase-related protein 4-like [Nicotiana sylvestris]|uniref:Tryptophan aminotransferase-related protein 4-like n=1 Tax=Nicotiana sylvestris TaxID=4096 RepID=A0A1U7W010_NICSY|nr:PREDICTED: tryptophan aminotransferase-related protein 4-like [Nicotiana sylvestris]XP_016481988.1 PREDICTED: tryptophan aminotransferase-related protein 4-like [Nicotiana tabacum]